HGLQKRDEIAAAGAAGLSALCGQEVDDQVAGDPEEPAAEGAAGRVGIPPVDRTGHGAEDVLGEVVGVGPLKPPAARPPVDQRLVDLHELGPGRLVARVEEPDQKALPRARRIGHIVPSWKRPQGMSQNLTMIRERPRTRSSSARSWLTFYGTDAPVRPRHN